MKVYVRVANITREVRGVYADQNVELKSESLIPFEVQNLAQSDAQPSNDAEFTGLQREELAALPDAAIAAGFRDIAGRNYREAYASLFRAHVIEKARKVAASPQEAQPMQAEPALAPKANDDIALRVHRLMRYYGINNGDELFREMRAVAAQTTLERLPPILFDGFSVLQALTPEARRRTGPENVSDTLDAVVRIVRGEGAV